MSSRQTPERCESVSGAAARCLDTRRNRKIQEPLESGLLYSCQCDGSCIGKAAVSTRLWVSHGIEQLLGICSLFFFRFQVPLCQPCRYLLGHSFSSPAAKLTQKTGLMSKLLFVDAI
ncbi:hypothetical protein TGGT1_361930 [Toxoplasma gondii GT1]|uniref:Uncharacterized protein n=2 Tax=Toxoplasma gondii TaxID=5811 RepID=S7W3L2_TOXGG|nr:hypothetical protein TGGT1_361930 [Toxoplasma gondii GT1]PUA86200.1 hypothetical protein TGBR9_361930 [Toxoplasma gondii TgCATBr9]